MSEQAFFVLSALAREPLHGYAILAEVAELSESRVRLRVGTLYGILDRLATDGSIELDHEEVVDSRLRRYYRLTTRGRHALTREAARQSANARMATARLAERPRPASGGSP
jgi:DNA-binding PadR family transcriptional regulator